MKDYLCMTFLLWRVRANPCRFLERVMFRTITREAGELCFCCQLMVKTGIERDAEFWRT